MIDAEAPRSTWIHCGSENALDQRVPVFPSVAFEAGNVAFSTEEAVVGFPCESKVEASAAVTAVAEERAAPAVGGEFTEPARSATTLTSTPIPTTRLRSRGRRTFISTAPMEAPVPCTEMGAWPRRRFLAYAATSNPFPVSNPDGFRLQLEGT